MAHEMEKVSGVHMKIALSQLIIKNFQDDTHILVVIKVVLFISGCYIILLLKKNGWKGLGWCTTTLDLVGGWLRATPMA